MITASARDVRSTLCYVSSAAEVGRELRRVGASVRVEFRIHDHPTRKRSWRERFAHPNRLRRGRVERMADGG